MLVGSMAVSRAWQRHPAHNTRLAALWVAYSCVRLVKPTNASASIAVMPFEATFRNVPANEAQLVSTVPFIVQPAGTAADAPGRLHSTNAAAASVIQAHSGGCARAVPRI